MKCKCKFDNMIYVKEFRVSFDNSKTVVYWCKNCGRILKNIKYFKPYREFIKISPKSRKEWMEPIIVKNKE